MYMVQLKALQVLSIYQSIIITRFLEKNNTALHCLKPAENIPLQHKETEIKQYETEA